MVLMVGLTYEDVKWIVQVCPIPSVILTCHPSDRLVCFSVLSFFFSFVFPFFFDRIMSVSLLCLFGAFSEAMANVSCLFVLFRGPFTWEIRLSPSGKRDYPTLSRFCGRAGYTSLNSSILLAFGWIGQSLFSLILGENVQVGVDSIILPGSNLEDGCFYYEALCNLLLK